MDSFGYDLSYQDKELIQDLVIHGLVTGKSLEDTYNIISKLYKPTHEFNTKLVQVLAKDVETILLLDNHRAVMLWAYLLPTYKEHKGIANPKCTSISISKEDIKNVLGFTTEVSTGTFSTALSRVKDYINKTLPKGTILVSRVNLDIIVFSFISASLKEDAHRLLVDNGYTSLNSIDKIIAQLGV